MLYKRGFRKEKEVVTFLGLSEICQISAIARTDRTWVMIQALNLALWLRPSDRSPFALSDSWFPALTRRIQSQSNFESCLGKHMSNNPSFVLPKPLDEVADCWGDAETLFRTGRLARVELHLTKISSVC